MEHLRGHQPADGHGMPMSERKRACCFCPKASCDGNRVAKVLRTYNLRKRFDDAVVRKDLPCMLDAVNKLITMYADDKKTRLGLVSLKSKVLSKTWRLQDRFDLLREHTVNVVSGDLDEEGRELMQSLRAERLQVRKRLSLRGSVSDSALFRKGSTWHAEDRVQSLGADAWSLEVRSFSEPDLTPRNVVIEVEEGDEDEEIQ